MQPKVRNHTRQLAHFFSTLSQAASIAGHEESWSHRPKKPKTRKRQRERGESLSR